MVPRLSAKPDLMAVLQDRGFKSTGPRRDVVQAIEDRGDGFTVDAISQSLSGVGRATVFRTIKLLLDAGVLCKLAQPTGAATYALARLEHHHHTICISCGQVGEFRDVTIERLMRSLSGDISGEIVGHRIEFFITCQTCLTRNGSQ